MIAEREALLPEAVALGEHTASVASTDIARASTTDTMASRTTYGETASRTHNAATLATGTPDANISSTRFATVALAS